MTIIIKDLKKNRNTNDQLFVKQLPSLLALTSKQIAQLYNVG